MPSPLRTARMDIIPHKVKAQNSGTARQVPTSDTMTRNIRTAHPIDNTTMYIEGGSQRQKSLVFLQSREREELKKFKKKHQKSTAFSNEPDKKCCRKSDEKQKKKRRKHPNILELKLRKEKQSRGLLGLTHVSIPRRALKRYPLFTHCKQSIRKDALDNDVVIQPLSGSERSSLCELSISDPTSKSQDGTKELQELVDVDRYIFYWFIVVASYKYCRELYRASFILYLKIICFFNLLFGAFFIYFVIDKPGKNKLAIAQDF